MLSWRCQLDARDEAMKAIQQEIGAQEEAIKAREQSLAKKEKEVMEMHINKLLSDEEFAQEMENADSQWWGDVCGVLSEKFSNPGLAALAFLRKTLMERARRLDEQDAHLEWQYRRDWHGIETRRAAIAQKEVLQEA